MSQFTDELRAYVDRLAKDGYPTALVERAAERMDAMEETIIKMKEQIDDLIGPDQAE